MSTSGQAASLAPAPARVPLVVVGCGNPAQGDDAVGLEVVRRLQIECQDSRCGFYTLNHTGVELLDMLESAQVLMVIDAISTGAPAGSLHLIPFPSTGIPRRAVPPVSGHEWDPFSVLELAGALGRRLPRVILLGIEIDTARAGSTLSEPVARAAQTVVVLFPSLIARLVDSRTPVSPSEPALPDVSR
jgi:hydrogenase maturation protease